jgi:hypothetical protein
VEHYLVAEWCVAISAQFMVLRAVASCPGRCSRWSSALGKSRHFTNNWLRNVKMAAYSICPHQNENFHSFAIICSKPHVASSIRLRHNFSKPRMNNDTAWNIYENMMTIFVPRRWKNIFQYRWVYNLLYQALTERSFVYIVYKLLNAETHKT